jgi:hypothetical protein
MIATATIIVRTVNRTRGNFMDEASWAKGSWPVIAQPTIQGLSWWVALR